MTKMVLSRRARTIKTKKMHIGHTLTQKEKIELGLPLDTNIQCRKHYTYGTIGPYEEWILTEIDKNSIFLREYSLIEREIEGQKVRRWDQVD